MKVCAYASVAHLPGGSLCTEANRAASCAVPGTDLASWTSGIQTTGSDPPAAGNPLASLHRCMLILHAALRRITTFHLAACAVLAGAQECR